MTRTQRVARGVYELVGTSDANGYPYRVVHTIGQWRLEDSRGRHISVHFTRADAVAEIIPDDAKEAL